MGESAGAAASRSDLLARLGADRATASQRLDALRRDHARMVDAAALVSTDDEHDPDGATSAFERAQIDALIGATTSRLADTERAIADLSAGVYGRCQHCGEPIGAERLEARPSATTCIECARDGSPVTTR